MPGSAGVARVGLVVSKAVGNAVMRNRVKRRLRHLAGGYLGSTGRVVDVVIRALPAAAADPGRLSEDVAAAWSQSLDKLARRAVSA